MSSGFNTARALRRTGGALRFTLIVVLIAGENSVSPDDVRGRRDSGAKSDGTHAGPVRAKCRAGVRTQARPPLDSGD